MGTYIYSTNFKDGIKHAAGSHAVTKHAVKYINKYPKFLLLSITIAIAYLLFSGKSYPPIHEFFLSLGYIGTFVTGVLFVYSFTAAPATAVFLILAKEQNILIAGLIGGIGALAGDMLLFRFIRHSFADEVEKLSKEYIIVKLKHFAPELFRKYLVPVIASIIIASPLPDEIGIAMLAAFKAISTKAFVLLSYVLNTVGIFVILAIGNSL